MIKDFEMGDAYTSKVRHSCLKPPSTSWKTPAWIKSIHIFLAFLFLVILWANSFSQASIIFLFPRQSFEYFSIQLIFIMRRTRIQCDGSSKYNFGRKNHIIRGQDEEQEDGCFQCLCLCQCILICICICICIWICICIRSCTCICFCICLVKLTL